MYTWAYLAKTAFRRNNQKKQKYLHWNQQKLRSRNERFEKNGNRYLRENKRKKNDVLFLPDTPLRYDIYIYIIEIEVAFYFWFMHMNLFFDMVKWNQLLIKKNYARSKSSINLDLWL